MLQASQGLPQSHRHRSRFVTCRVANDSLLRSASWDSWLLYLSGHAQGSYDISQSGWFSSNSCVLSGLFGCIFQRPHNPYIISCMSRAWLFFRIQVAVVTSMTVLYSKRPDGYCDCAPTMLESTEKDEPKMQEQIDDRRCVCSTKARYTRMVRIQ
ncbi:hypothetical protein BC835DRAFT_614218 [Cytidiella melzeri]|nr:hypothetical protein BC835DRAFT_614218 [Cytidiella melzeri]